MFFVVHFKKLFFIIYDLFFKNIINLSLNTYFQNLIFCQKKLWGITQLFLSLEDNMNFVFGFFTLLIYYFIKYYFNFWYFFPIFSQHIFITKIKNITNFFINILNELLKFQSFLMTRFLNSIWTKSYYILLYFCI